MRRVLAALAAAAVLLPGASIARALPAGAASSSGYAPSPTAPAGGDASDARARRSDLLARIAALTDQMDGTQADVVAAELRQNEVDGQVAKAKARIRARAVAAYIRGLNTPGDMSTPAAYLEVAARKERELLSQFHDAAAKLATRRTDAEQARAALRSTAAELDRARAQLDAQVAAEDAQLLAATAAAERQAADDARRRALATSAAATADALGRARAGGENMDGLLPRHRQATQAQHALMARYPFGVLPAGPLPASLRPSGETSSGMASWYGGEFNGRPTASGAIFDEDGWTAASRTLPLGTMIVVSRNGVSVLLLVNDRGPYVDGRVLDLSAAAARALGVGVSNVDVQVVTPA
ncbi:MAG TPA: septal ring lytic transglycosylase RlpA family protein [Acidimicrobiales bacterium]|nr:septal ring lytic transglycosylase RlpA family protein [Acidimicrobiales bacterium]